MSQRTFRLLLMVTLVFLVGLAVSSWLIPGSPRLNAQVTNQKLFVHCMTVEIDNPPQYMHYVLTCTTEDGIPFVENGTTPPATQRFYLTDIILNSVDDTYFNLYQSGVMTTDLWIGAYGSREQLVNFTSPYFVLLHGDYLYSNRPFYASGYVISNQTFLPNISK